MHSAVNFGDYFFAQSNQRTFTDNFRKLLSNTRRLPGVSGGFNEFVGGKLPSGVGVIRMSTILYGNTPRELQMKIDEIAGISQWGQKKLFILTMDGQERFCSVNAIDVDYTQNVKEMSTLRQLVELTFEAPSPFWLKANDNADLRWGDFFWNEHNWGDSADARSFSPTGIKFVETNNGNAEAYPVIIVTVPSSASITDIRIQRQVDGAVRDEVRYRGTVQNSVLTIDTLKKRVTIGNSNAYNSNFTNFRNRFFILKPGNNNISVLADNQSGQCEIFMRYNERFV